MRVGAPPNQGGKNPRKRGYDVPMGNFIVNSIVASILLTILLNLVPLLFPNVAAGVQRKLQEYARRVIELHEDDNQSQVKVFFPGRVCCSLHRSFSPSS